MDQILKVPKQFTSSDALETATFLNLELKGSTKPLIEYDIVEVINQQQVFEEERNQVRDYRFSGRINLFTANEITPTEAVFDPISGNNTVINGALNEDYDPLFDGDPAITPNNWLLQILYPFKSLPEFTIESYTSTNSYTSLANQGPQITEMFLTKPSGEEQKVGVRCVQKHGLKEGDYIHICNNDNLNPYYGFHRVLILGTNGENLETEITLDTEFIVNYNNISNLRKIVNPSSEDLNFKNSFNITNVTATDEIGGVNGTFNNNDEIYLSIDINDDISIELLKRVGDSKLDLNPISIPTNPPQQSNIPYAVSTPQGTPLTNPSVLNYYTPDITSPTLPYIEIKDGGTLNGLYKLTKLVITNQSVPNKMIIKSLYITNKGQSQNFTTPNNPKFKILEGTPSDYYVRQYKVLTTNKYEVYKCGFSSSIYPKTIINELGIGNKTWLYHFNEDINVEPLIDNLNRPITDLYLGYIKRAGQNTFPWSKVVAGWDFNSQFINTQNGLETISNFTTNGVGTIEKSDLDSSYLGDYVEYNSLEIKEKVLSKIVHRFGEASKPDAEGYYLNPFKKLKIMDFSSVIETSSLLEEVENIPNYAEIYPNLNISWRDLMEIGFINPDDNSGVDYPFVNGKHYFYGNYNFYLRRQIVRNDKVLDTSNVKTAKIEECDCE